MKYVFYILIACSLAGLGFYFGKNYNSSNSISKTDQSILLERIKDVFKVVYVEAQFNEIINHKDYTWFDLSPFRKTAIIRVQATVHAGIDMDSSRLELDELHKTLNFYLDTTPVILSIEHKMDYFDLQQGSFNYFKPEELSSLEENATSYIRQKAMQSDLLHRCSIKRNEMIQLMEDLAKGVGWKVDVKYLINKKYLH